MLCSLPRTECGLGFLGFFLRTHLQQNEELPDTTPKAKYLKVSMPGFASEVKAKFFSGRTCLHSVKRCDCSQAWEHAAAQHSALGYVSTYVLRVWFLTSLLELHVVANCAVYWYLNWLHESSLSCGHATCRSIGVLVWDFGGVILVGVQTL